VTGRRARKDTPEAVQRRLRAAGLPQVALDVAEAAAALVNGWPRLAPDVTADVTAILLAPGASTGGGEE